MNRNLFITIALSAFLYGCGDSSYEPPSQKAFYDNIESLQDEWDKAESTNNKILIGEVEKKIKSFLKDTKHQASKWVGTVDEVRLAKNEYVKLYLEHRNQEYKLIIIDPAAKAIASRLKSGDIIIFNGDLGREMSVTIEGGLDNPEFSFPPLSFKVAKENDFVVQSNETIEQFYANKKKEILHSRTENKVLLACEAKIKSMLLKPSSADFSILNRSIREARENQWVYMNTVDAENAYGGELEVRASCNANTTVVSGNPIIESIKVNLY